MSDKFVYAVEVEYGKVGIKKCKIIKETEKQLIISDVYGYHGTNTVKKSEMRVCGRDIVLEENIKGYLTGELSRAIQHCERAIQIAQNKKATYTNMLGKIDSLIEKVNEQ